MGPSGSPKPFVLRLDSGELVGGLRYRAWSMSSIKRDVKKKAPPRPEDRGSFSRSSPLCFVTSEDVRLVDHLVSFLCCWWQRSSVQDAASRTTVSRVGGGALTRWPPSAAQTVRADFRHTAITKTPASGSPNRAKVLER